MYEISALSVPDTIRAGDPFRPIAEICCRTSVGETGCSSADAVMTLDGEVIATAGLDLDQDHCAALSPPGDDFGPSVTAAVWVEVVDESVIVHDPGRHRLAVTVGDVRDEWHLDVGPSRGQLDAGPAIEHGGCCDG